jgi:hypothetical protein
VKIDGASEMSCALRFIGESPKVSVRMDGKPLRRRVSKPHPEFIVPGGAELTVSWDD